MRINNNITAMNSYRSMTQVDERMSKTMEKLSSGQRINRAGDDAAGLAISEKMRSQIKGLDMATKNSQSQQLTNRPVSDETILKVSKEIAIKFIEVGRLTPSTFNEIFKNIHTTIKQSVER